MVVSVIYTTCGSVACKRYTDVSDFSTASYFDYHSTILIINRFSSNVCIALDDVLEIIVDGVTVYEK